jgi:5-methylcytosine-specific restriction endonuclease McrA
MLHLTRPAVDARTAFKLCASSKISPAKLALLSAYEEPIVHAAEVYEQACQTASLHDLNLKAFKPPKGNKAGTDALINMYERRMRGKEYPGRPIYDLIRNQRTKCPLCGVGSVRQVDHHLPKSQYPYLAVVPANLLPVCSDCNFLKNDQIPLSSEEQTLHPYFDNIEGERWLRAQFVVEEPVVLSGVAHSATSWAVRFFVEPPSAWSRRLAARVEHHFKVFQLAKLYEEQTADELTTIGLALEEVFKPGDSEDVQAHLLDLAHTRARPRQNNWMAALYEALAASSWYRSGGFRLVASG